MVELRWVERPLFSRTSPLPEGVKGYIPNVRVLQYRVTHLNLGFSEWRDVPTVSEQEAGR